MSINSLNPIGTKLVREGCEKWPDLPNRTLARKLCNDNPGVWTGIDICRLSVSYHRGRMHVGNKRKACANPIASTSPRVPHNPRTYIPKSEERPFLPYVVEVDRDTNVLVLGDIHVPYHSVSALRAAIDHGKSQNCKVVILNGDTLDFHRLSRFQKDPRSRSAKAEVGLVNELLDSLDDVFPKAKKIWKDGNHDERFDSYVTANAPEIFDLIKDMASLPQLLELKERGWDCVSEKRPMYLGGLTLIHGHEYPQSLIGPVNAARGLFLRAKASAMVNHHHQTSEHTEPTVRGKMITTWSLGCLCELSPMYARFNKWNHGAATVELAKDGEFRVHNFRIQGGRLLN